MHRSLATLSQPRATITDDDSWSGMVQGFGAIVVSFLSFWSRISSPRVSDCRLWEMPPTHIFLLHVHTVYGHSKLANRVLERERLHQWACG